MKKYLLPAALCLALCGSCSKSASNGADARMDEFIDSLMSEMTLEEKLGQLNLLTYNGDIATGLRHDSDMAAEVARGRVGGVLNARGYKAISELQHLAVDSSRLGIPLMFGLDVIHGYQTVFPIPLAQSCSWDMAAIEEAASVAAAEAAADGLDWTYSPMVDISRDPRWGRVAEGAGEDPFLGSCVAAAMVRGYQGSDLSSPRSVMSCVKHFACYGASEGGRDYNAVDMSRIRMYNEYLPPYKAAVDAGVGSVMTSFNVIDFVPATANKWLLSDLLRGQWGFKGFVVTDYTAIAEMEAHGLGDLAECSRRALKAGVDMDMIAQGFIGTFDKALQQGDVSQKEIDTAVRRVLEAKYKLGLFADPFRRISEHRIDSVKLTPESRTLARRLAAESFVLLKNSEGLLPLRRDARVALIGPICKARKQLQGTWCVAADYSDYLTLHDAFAEASGGRMTYAQGCRVSDNERVEPVLDALRREVDYRTDDEALLREAVQAARGADVILLALGETAEMSGESNSMCDISLPATQKRLIAELSRLGKPMVLLNFSGRPNVLTDVEPQLDAILNVWFPGTEGAHAICDVVYGDFNPCGRLTMSMPRSVGQIPVYYAMLPTGRPVDPAKEGYQMYRSNYMDVENSPLYPFGYGLSYTTFAYGDLQLSGSKLADGGKIVAKVKVTNTGTRRGTETVQFYIADPVASVSRPVKELKHFERVALDPGQSAEVSFEITPEQLAFYNSDLNLVAEPGEFRVMAGSDSERLQSASFVYEQR